MAANPNVVDTTKPEALVPDTEDKPVLEPLIQVEVQDRLLRELKRRLFPNDVEGILYSAIVGDLYWQDQLWSLMVDTWPRLLTNLGKLKDAVGSMEYAVNPYQEEGEDATKSAIEKAHFVKDALFKMHGDVARQEHDFAETLKDIVDSLIAGFTVMEVYWENRDGGIVPQCTRWLPARYYRYPYVLDDVDRLMLNPSGMLGGTQLVDFPPYKFLVCIKQSHANHPVFTAPMRCLTAWWIASRFGLEWFMTFAQLFGIPRRIAYYKPGDNIVYQQLVTMMRQSAAATWGVYPEGTKVEDQTGAGANSTHMPQERLIDEADKVCDIMLLGQTLTTEVRESGGNRALGTVHRKVMDEVMEAAARYCCKVITTQIIPGIVQYNFGNVDELPVLEPVVNTPIDLFNLAQAYNILFAQMKIPVLKKELYDRIEFTPPEDDDDVYEPPAAPTLAPGAPFGEGQPQPNGARPEPAGAPNGDKGPPELKPNVVQRVGAAFDPGEARDEEGKWTTDGGGKPDLSSAQKTTQPDAKLWHGTNEKSASILGDEVYFTDDKSQAQKYAEAAHNPALGAVKKPKVWAVSLKAGKALDINGPLEQGMNEGFDAEEVIQHAAGQARKTGYRYLHFDHPNAGKQGTHHVAISLYPGEDIGAPLQAYEEAEQAKSRYPRIGAAGNGDGDPYDDDDDPDDGPFASAGQPRKVSFALDYGEEPEPGEVLRFVEGAGYGGSGVTAAFNRGGAGSDRGDDDGSLVEARHERRHPKTGRFVPEPKAPKRKVGVKRAEPMPQVGLMLKHSQTVEDDRVCQACKDICEEGWIPVDEEYLGYSANPPHHPNCRCSNEYKTQFRGVDILHQTKSGNPHHHPQTGRFVSKPKRA